MPDTSHLGDKRSGRQNNDKGSGKGAFFARLFFRQRARPAQVSPSTRWHRGRWVIRPHANQRSSCSSSPSNTCNCTEPLGWRIRRRTEAIIGPFILRFRWAASSYFVAGTDPDATPSLHCQRGGKFPRLIDKISRSGGSLKQTFKICSLASPRNISRNLIHRKNVLPQIWYSSPHFTEFEPAH